MYDKKWLELNIRELISRAQSTSEFSCGYFVIMRENNIDLIKSNDAVKFTVVRKKFVSYEKLIKAETVEERIKVFLDSVRNCNYYFSVDRKIIDIILYGMPDDDKNDEFFEF